MPADMENRYVTGETVKPENRLVLSKVDAITDAIFDEYLGNIVNPPASPLQGVTIVQGE